jgi:hypothetical protein
MSVQRQELLSCPEPAPPADSHEISETGHRTVLDAVDVPSASASVLLNSGRRYELESHAEADRLVVRSPHGEIVLRIEVSDQGPVLSFSGADVVLEATRRLCLTANQLRIEARADATLTVAGSLRQTVGGTHHTTVAGDERLEASNVELQASRGAVGVRALRRISLDGEHIGLNDDPLPRPFGWSAIAEGPGDTDLPPEIHEKTGARK